METKEETPPSPSFSLSAFFSDKIENIQNFFETKFNAMNIFSTALYILATTCVLVNLYVLLDRSIETIHYLRIYHLVGLILSLLNKNCIPYGNKIKYKNDLLYYFRI